MSGLIRGRFAHHDPVAMVKAVAVTAVFYGSSKLVSQFYDLDE